MLTVSGRVRKAGLGTAREILFPGSAPAVFQVFDLFDGARLAQEWVSLVLLGDEGGARAEVIVEVIHWRSIKGVGRVQGGELRWCESVE